MRTYIHLFLFLLAASLALFSQTAASPSSQNRETSSLASNWNANAKEPTPTVFQADEGDRWMLLGDKPLIFKVDPVSTGSDTLVVGTEVMPPGNRIPTHQHIAEDEVIFVHQGAVRVTLAGKEYDAGTGATVFIPHGTWIGVQNVTSQPALILFFFNKPAFEHCLRAMSSRPGEKFTMPPPDKMQVVRAECHEVMK